MRGYLPGAALPHAQYDAVISNSLLHHLLAPEVLWDTVKHCARPGAPIFVMDLFRPQSQQQAHALVEQYAADEMELLKRDFYHSLLAAYTLEEVRAQLAAAELGYLTVETVSDRHMVIHGHYR